MRPRYDRPLTVLNASARGSGAGGGLNGSETTGPDARSAAVAELAGARAAVAGAHNSLADAWSCRKSGQGPRTRPAPWGRRAGRSNARSCSAGRVLRWSPSWPVCSAGPSGAGVAELAGTRGAVSPASVREQLRGAPHYLVANPWPVNCFIISSSVAS